MNMVSMSFSIFSSQSIISGHNESKWLFPKVFHQQVSVPLHFRDAIHTHLTSILGSSTHTHTDQIKSPWMSFPF